MTEEEILCISSAIRNLISLADVLKKDIEKKIDSN